MNSTLEQHNHCLSKAKDGDRIVLIYNYNNLSKMNYSGKIVECSLVKSGPVLLVYIPDLGARSPSVYLDKIIKIVKVK